VLFAGACASTAAAEPAPTGADDHDGDETTLRFDYEQEPAVIGVPVCSPATSCVVPFSLVLATSGDFRGSVAQAGGGTVMPHGALFANSALVFTGRIRGCGTGTVAMTSTGLNRAGVTSGTVEVVEGSGTGDLAGLTGTGTASGQAGASGGTGVVEIEIEC